MNRPVMILAAAALALLVACGTQDTTRPPVTPERTADAQVMVEAIEKDLRALPTLAPQDRIAKERTFGKRLEEALPVVAGTRHENAVCYWLANWRLEYQRDEAGSIEAILDRLDACEMPMLQMSGRLIRLRVRLIQGRIEDAQRIAVDLDERVPELGAGTWVAHHRLLGLPAPAIPGQPLTATSTLIAFLPGGAASQDWLARLATAKPPSIALVPLVLGGTPLEALTLPDARWVPSDVRPTLRSAWSLPLLPTACLVGADGRILAVDLRPEELARLPR